MAGDASQAAPAPAADATAAALAVATVPDPDGGYGHAELGKEKLVGSVGFYERHVFLCYKGPDVWPSHLEGAESDRLPRLLAAAIKDRKPSLKKTIKLTICEGEDGTESSNGDVLIFPDMMRYKGLTQFHVDNFVEEVLVKDVEWFLGPPEPMSGSYVFVCSHGSRDKRCGVCGLALIKRFKKEINRLGLDGKVSVTACAHIGGHKYAGNVIIFSSGPKGDVIGHWYGYVVPDDVHVLLHKHIGQGEIVDHLWRGQMGLSEEQQKQALELRSMRKGGKVIRIDDASCNPAAAGGCCQGNGGFTCCQTDQKKEKQDKSITAEQNPKSSEENDKEGGGAGSKKRMSTRFETWERADQYPAPRTKWSRLPLSPARDIEWRLKPTSHRPNPHQGRKGSPSIFYRDWSPALRGKENEHSTSRWMGRSPLMEMGRSPLHRSLSHKEMGRSPLMEMGSPPLHRSLSHKEMGRSPLMEMGSPPLHRSLSHKEMGRSPLMELTPSERDIRGWGRIGPQAERDFNWSERGLRVRPQGDQVSQVFHHTPYWKSTSVSHSQRRTEWNENSKPPGVSHSHNQRWAEWNERGLKRARGEWEVRARGEWNGRERARGERVVETRHTLPPHYRHMLYSSRIITSSPRLKQKEYDEQPVEIKTPSYDAHSD